MHHHREKGRAKSAFLSGVVVLTVSGLLTKMAGLLFKIPMNYIVGDTGMGYYNSAYSIYTFFYMLATSGLPVALSVMVSEKRASGNVTGAKAVYRAAFLLFAAGGLLTSGVMLFGAGSLADLIRSDKSALSVMIAAPTMFFICISSAVRGYFQGCGNMVPTAVSQLIEAVGKLVIGIAAAMYAIRMGYEIHVIAAYAVSGLTLGSLAGMLYLLLAKCIRRDRDLMPENNLLKNESSPVGEILSRFWKISLPVTVSASVMSLSGMIDTAMIQRVLQNSGMSGETAAALYGNYTSLAVPMFNLPPVLVYPIAYSLVPAVAAAFASGNTEEARERIGTSLRFAVIIGLPCAMGLTVLADPILCLLYKPESAHMASPLLTLLAPSSFFVCILAVTNSILQSCGQERKPVISMLAGAMVKLISGRILLQTMGISGAPISTLLCYLTVTVLNFSFVVRVSGIKPAADRIFLRPLLSSSVCTLTALAAYRILSPGIGGKAGCLGAILTAAAVYLVCLMLTKSVETEEIFALFGRSKKRKDSINLERTNFQPEK